MDCVLCHPQKENIVWENKELRVIQVDDPLFPGYFRVIWNKHIAEMSDLTDDERQLLEKVLLTVEKVVREQMQPDKIGHNLAIWFLIYTGTSLPGIGTILIFLSQFGG